MYFIIYNRDGETHLEELDANTSKGRLDEKYYGNVEFKSEIGYEPDTNYWGKKILIIKGDVIIPQAVQYITEYKL